MKKIKKVTKVEQEKYLKRMLSTSPRAATKALVIIFENQTEDEQINETVSHHNNIGFTGVDGEFLTSLAKQFIKYKRLSEKQMVHVLKKMPKYWGQILQVTDIEKLNQQIIERRVQNVSI